MASSSYVKFDREGRAYVNLEDLRQQPEVRRQVEAARRVMARVRGEGGGAPHPRGESGER